MHQTAARKDETIQIRASLETKNLLNKAATLRGQKLSEFMLDVARQKAEETLLDQRIFFLDAEDHERFLALLDAPPHISEDAYRRLTRPTPWQRK